MTFTPSALRYYDFILNEPYEFYGKGYSRSRAEFRYLSSDERSSIVSTAKKLVILESAETVDDVHLRKAFDSFIEAIHAKK